MKKILLLFLVLILATTNTASSTFVVVQYNQTGNYNFTVPVGVSNVSVLVVSGGGGGASGFGGGGGAGGLTYQENYAVTQGTNITVVVGDGGAGAPAGASGRGQNGTNSSFGTITTLWGGYGASTAVTAGHGGSGGGSSEDAVNGTGVAGQGFNGARGFVGTAATATGGGGGGANSSGYASGNNYAPAASIPGNGGSGFLSAINGTWVTYACGGGGSSGSTYISGGTAGCTNGGNGGGGTGQDAANRTGSGGGAGAFNGAAYLAGGRGGNGTVIINYTAPPLIYSWSNNYTNDNTLNFTKLTSSDLVNFTINTSQTIQFYNWTVNNVDQNINRSHFNISFSIAGQYFVNATANNSVTNMTISWNVTAANYSLELRSPANNSVSVSTSPSLVWREWPQNAPYTYQVATDSQFINIVVSGTGTTYGNETVTAALSGLSYYTTYYWRSKNSTGSYINWFNFTTTSPAVVPGRLNISVWNEQNTTQIISTYNVNIYGADGTYATKSATNGWANFTSSEVTAQEYLIIAIPNASYAQRMVLATIPSNVTMYVPSTNNTIYLVSFSLLDVTGNFPYKTSTITTTLGNLTVDKSYFSADATHPVYLINGSNYGVTIQNGNNIFRYDNFVPVSSAIATIAINDFTINDTQLNVFRYNITHTNSDVTLKWVDNYNDLNHLDFNVFKGTSLTQICSLMTSVKIGQNICALSGDDKYYVSFSALLTDGTFQNQSFWFDTRVGQKPTSEGIHPIDGSPMGTGYIFQYGNYTMPDWVYTAVSVIMILLLLGSWGAFYGDLGAVVTSIFALFFASKGWFAPLGTSTTSQGIVISILTFMTMLAFISYLAKFNKGSSMMIYKLSMGLIFANFGIMIVSVALAPYLFPGSGTSAPGYQGNDFIMGLNIHNILNGAAGFDMEIFGIKFNLVNMVFSSGLLALFAFSLLIPTIPIMRALFTASLLLTEYHIVSTIPGGFDVSVDPMAFYFKLPLMIGVGAIYVVGLSQYAARSALNGS